MLAAPKWPGVLASRDRPGEARLAAAPDPLPGRRCHICFVAPNAWLVISGQTDIPFAGGAEVQQATLARLLAGQGYRVSMICQDFGQPDGVQIDGVVVRKVFGARDGVPVLRFVHPRLTTMWRALREVDADIYYYRSACMWLGVLAEFCRRHGKRLVYAGAADPDFAPDIGGQIRYARDRWLYRHGLRRAHAIVVQNRVQLEGARAHYGRDAVHIPSCYELPRGAGGERRDRVLWVATLRPTKRPELFLELARRLPDWRFTMVGPPAPEAPALSARVADQAQKLSNVEFTGFLPLAEVEKWFDRARVFVNTSLYEGMPNTFLQAWARGVPTIATVDVGAPVGCAVEDVDALAGELERLLRDDEAWRRASASCREHFARTYSPEEVVRRYARVFDSVMSDPPTRTR